MEIVQKISQRSNSQVQYQKKTLQQLHSMSVIDDISTRMCYHKQNFNLEINIKITSFICLEI